jgi:hypothetical protein
MTASAKGDAADPGKRVAQKSGLNRSILDVGMGDLRRQLDYKARRTGAVLVAVHPAYTSQTCSECGCVDKANRPDQATFHCIACGHTANADANAARNIRAAGLARLAEGVEEKIIKRVGKVNPTRKKHSAQADSTADAAGYARGGSSLEDRPMNRERGLAESCKALSGGLTAARSISAQATLPF